MSVVDIRAVSVTYADHRALAGVDLTIADGELFALLGPSGSGKTTLLRAIAGFVVPDEGEIVVDGADVRGVPVHRRAVGMVFQHYALFPHMSVYDNVAFGLTVRGTPAAEVRLRVAELLGLVQLDGLEARRPSQLSGGQQQRVALARALVTRPRVLLLDEPLGALDKRLRQQMQVELKTIQREVGITTVFVTHDQEEALTLADRVALLDDGDVVQVGTPDEVYERPRTRFAAEFLGDANFLPLRVEGGAEGRAVGRLPDGGLVRFSAPNALPGGTERTFAIRPEKLSLSAAGREPEGENCLAGTVTRAVFQGSSTVYTVAAGGLALTVLRQNTGGERFREGSAVTVAWRGEHMIGLE